MAGKSQPCNKELQCTSEPQLQPNKTITLSGISSWEWTHSHSPCQKEVWAISGFAMPPFYVQIWQKKSQITELAKHTRVKHGREQCFLKDWPKSQSCFEDEPKNEQQKGSCLQDAPGNYWRNDTVLEKLTQGNMYIRNQLQWGGEATSCLGFTQNHLSRGVRALSPSTTH